MLDKSDQIRKHVIGSRTGFGRAEREEILALYPEKSVLERLMKEDGDRFVKAAKACGVDFSKTEPITDLTRQFEKDLDLKLTAAEVGVTADEFRGGLARSPKLERLFGTLRSDGTTIQRQVLNAHFQELAEVMQPYN